MKKYQPKLLFAILVIVTVPIVLLCLTIWYFGWVIWRRYWQLINLSGLVASMRESFYEKLGLETDDSDVDDWFEKRGN